MRSDQYLRPASAAVSMHPCGFGFCKIYPKVTTHSGEIIELCLCGYMDGTPRGFWHLPGHALDQAIGFLMGR